MSSGRARWFLFVLFALTVYTAFFFTSGMFLDNICIVISTARNVTKLLRPEPIDAQNGSQI